MRCAASSIASRCCWTDCVELEMTATQTVAWFQMVPPLVHLRDRKIEGVAELVLERADDLAAVFQRLRVWDGEFNGQLSYWHSGWRHEVHPLWFG